MIVLCLFSFHVFSQEEPAACCGWTVVDDGSGNDVIQPDAGGSYLLNIEDIHPTNELTIHGSFSVDETATWNGDVYHTQSIASGYKYKIPIVDEHGRMSYVDIPQSLYFDLIGQATINATSDEGPDNGNGTNIFDPDNWVNAGIPDIERIFVVPALQDVCNDADEGTPRWENIFDKNIGINAKILCGVNTNVGIGTAYPQRKFHLADGGILIENEVEEEKALAVMDDDGEENIILWNNGKIAARDLEVKAEGVHVPDYVFEEDYELLSIENLKTFIKENGHLPGVPSAAEVEEKGSISVMDMQFNLLEKVEELTLYVIELESENKKLKEVVESLDEIQERLNNLENSK